ncbi:MAG: cell surface protein SprA [Candidatus Delongbacteria bacterium]|nr:cell surface protein SprA [Candidatus Delongbacteria bacterium]MBN2834645.1 cell surface protein SprA [Candidatus Delongbacteria bacterium]
MSKFLILIIIFLSIVNVFSLELKYDFVGRSRDLNIFDTTPKNYFGISKQDSTLFEFEEISDRYKTAVKIDSSGTYAVMNFTLFGEEYRSVEVMKIEDYTKNRIEKDKKLAWRKSVVQNVIKGYDENQSDEIAIDIPIKIKSKNFHRIFGGNKIGLRLNGTLYFDLAAKKSSSNSNTSSEDNDNLSFEPKTQMDLKITGKIGEKVTVNIAQDTEKLDFENEIKITYQGDSDEIIEKLEAGNISLSLPATRYVTFSGQNKGLFGLKTDLRVGKFTSVFIASLEKGEKNEIKVSSNDQVERPITVDTKSYLRNTYFFIQDVFRDEMALKFDEKKGSGLSGLTSSEWRISEDNFLLFTNKPNYNSTSSKVKAKIYYYGAENGVVQNEIAINENELNVVQINAEDYEYIRELGIIRLKQNILSSSSDQLYITFSMTNLNTGEVKEIGTINTGGDYYKLHVFGSHNVTTDKQWFDLEWKNVYSVNASDVDKTKFKLEIKDSDDNSDNEGKNYLYWYDVAKNDDETSVNNIFLRPDLGHFIFPALRPFYPDELEKEFTALKDKNNMESALLDSNIYFNNGSIDEGKLKLYFKASGKGGIPSLGFNVLEGSEEVKSNSKVLVRDVDYIIDYRAGQITILRPDLYTDITITYESASIFQLDKKVLLGNRTQYNFGDNDFIGATAMYLSKSTKDSKVQVGQEPFENFIWDVNGKYSLELPFLTKTVDLLPLVETEAKSNLSFEGEFAQVIPNPNTEGKAYLDDFESSDKKRTLGMTHYNWQYAPVPENYPTSKDYSLNSSVEETDINPRYFLQPQNTAYNEDSTGFYWYNPKDDDKPKKEDIYEDVEGREATEKVNTMVFMFKPGGKQIALNEEIENVDSWSGVIRSLPGSYQDLSEIRYIEFVAKADVPLDMYIDLGAMSEDIVPNGFINSEDLLLDDEGENTIGYNNGLLDRLDEEDVGLDMIHKYNPSVNNETEAYSLKGLDSLQSYRPYYYSSFDDHPTSGNKITSAPKSDSDISYWQMNKTEGNGRLDTEDLNYNGYLDRDVGFYRYKIGLKQSNSYIVPGQGYKGGFALYRIPIDSELKTIIGSEPKLDEVKFVKVWFNNCSDESAKIEFISFDFVGNEWVATGDNREYLEAKVINNKDNTNYLPPPSIDLDKDDEGNLEKEQSLLLNFNFNQVMTNPPEAYVSKKYVNGNSFFLYKTLEMEIHGGDNMPGKTWFDPEEKDLFFVFRFGKDSVNYYEYSSELVEGWKEGSFTNRVSVDLDSFPVLKERRSDKRTKYSKRVHTNHVAGERFKRYISILGEPTLSDIKYYQIGVIDSVSSSGSAPAVGEIWVDDIILKDVDKEYSTAKRFRTELNFADLITSSAEISQQDADFHNLTTNRGSGVNSTQVSVDASIHLDKFTSSKWQLDLPFGYSYSRSYEVPKYQNQSDLLVKQSDPPDSSITKSEKHGFTYGFKKNSDSDNPFVKYSIDKLTYNGSTQIDRSSSPSDLKKESRRFSNTVSYNLQLSSDYLSFSPFSWLERVPYLRRLSEDKVTLIPLNYRTQIQTSQSMNEWVTRQTNKAYDNRDFKVNRSFGVASFNPISFINTTYDISFKSDMYRKVQKDSTGVDYETVEYSRDYADMLSLNFGELDAMESSFKASTTIAPIPYFRFSPSYIASYSWDGNIENIKSGRQNDNSRIFTFQTTFLNREMLKDISDLLNKMETDKPVDEEVSPASEEQEKDKPKNRGRGGSQKPKTITFTGGTGFVGFLEKNLSDISLDTEFSRANRAGKAVSFSKAPLDYWLGFSNNPGGDIDYETYNWLGKFNWGVKTSLKITENVSLGNLSYSNTKGFEYGNSGSFTGVNGWTSFGLPWAIKTYVKPGVNGNFDIPIPDYSLSIRGIEKFLSVVDYVTSIDIDHAKTGKESFNWSTDSITGYNWAGVPDLGYGYKLTKKDWSLSFSPLIKINITLANGLRLSAGTDYRFNMNEGYSSIKTDGVAEDKVQNGTKTYENGYDFTASYNQKGGFNLPFNFWPFNGRRVQNNIDYSFSTRVAFSETYNFKQTKYEYDSRPVESFTLTLNPKISYRFNRNLSGSLTYTFSTSSSNRSSVVTDNYDHELKLSMVFKLTGY